MSKYKKSHTLDYAYIIDNKEKNLENENQANSQVFSEPKFTTPNSFQNSDESTKSEVNPIADNNNFNNPSFQYKRFQDPILEEKEDRFSISKIKLPNFLQDKDANKNSSNKDLTKNEVDNISNPGKVLPFNQTEESQYNANLNSIGSIFNNDHEEISGLRRVFKKSITFLAIHLILFLTLTFVGLNFFKFSPIFSFLILFLNISFTNIFYIVVADRSYIWISILAQGILLIFANSFFGLAFNPITLILILLILLLAYLGYSELEKIQLSSRLFSISHITSETTRILLTAFTITICLGIFNGMLSEGSSNFVDRVLLRNNFLMDIFLIGENPKLATNYYLMGGKFSLDAEKKITYFDRNTNKSRQAVYADFLSENYQSISVLTQKEENDLRSTCGIDSDTPECNAKVKEEINKRLDVWKQLKYKGLETEHNLVALETPLDKENFRYITREFYIGQINDLENTKSNDADSLIPTDFLPIKISSIIPTVIPALVAITVFFLFSVFKFFVIWISLISTWVIWKILVWAGFVQIDIETVEAEIVSI